MSLNNIIVDQSYLQITMELCELGSVRDIMNALDNRAFKEEEIAYITKYALKALEDLHSNRKIHRDIKPGTAHAVLTACSLGV